MFTKQHVLQSAITKVVFDPITWLPINSTRPSKLRIIITDLFENCVSIGCIVVLKKTLNLPLVFHTFLYYTMQNISST